MVACFPAATEVVLSSRSCKTEKPWGPLFKALQLGSQQQILQGFSGISALDLHGAGLTDAHVQALLDDLPTLRQMVPSVMPRLMRNADFPSSMGGSQNLIQIFGLWPKAGIYLSVL